MHARGFCGRDAVGCSLELIDTSITRVRGDADPPYYEFAWNYVGLCRYRVVIKAEIVAQIVGV